MSEKNSNFIAFFLISIMFLLAFFSIQEDVFTFDETAHITAGYSYLAQNDYRLNPEHPPLIKDLAALPLLSLGLNFPKDSSEWAMEDGPAWWHQFNIATEFLYNSGNNPDLMMLYSRTMMILFLVLSACLLFYTARKFFGNNVAVLSLFLFCLEPNILAHGRLVTTDIGATFGVVLATLFWLNFLKEPCWKNIIFAGLAFGTAMLLKFSLILLIPFFIIITFAYLWTNKEKISVSGIFKYLGKSILVGLVGMLFVVYPVYQYHVSKEPLDRQIRDAKLTLESTSIPKPLAKADVWLCSNNITRPFGQYFLGVLMVLNRGATGNTTYFMGEISASGWKTYFPIIYSLKVPGTFLLLLLVSLLYAVSMIKKPIWVETFSRLRQWLKNHFPEFAMLTFVLIYWATSISSALNIGVRHLMPVFPFTILLVSVVIIKILERPFLGKPHTKLKYTALGIVLVWQAISIWAIYPNFLSYFNEIAGGPENGYIYATDSNLDWGQDLKRLKKWTDEKGINKIYVDYFGGGNIQYYFGEKYLPWWGSKNEKELPKGSYLAVSINQLQGGRAEAINGFDQPTDYYRWLDKYQPVAVIGYSIFVYRLQ